MNTYQIFSLLGYMNSSYSFKDGKTLHQDQHLTIMHVPSKKAIFIKVSGYLEEPEADNFFASTLEAIDETGASFIIGDFSDFKGSNLNIAKYANQVWIPKLAGKGITHAAMNIPKSEFGAFTLKIAMGRKAHNLIEIQHFAELGKGISWLQEIDR